ncbi:hypothetical protein OGAPHI_004842 [Ogataea philodendri]|uniref:mitogen-activated protein kinase kinase n=1 Tax=Ogataea philodendri TaxID=1378263 RepID=A0A9P8T2S6_9ASCO|nr:uncharacterized protein OGAPHI_004842 [Ogataea philodendri]KAH3664128.1 hypothetical protein OGAPHI_004842 [Ogataea philodendri]
MSAPPLLRPPGSNHKTASGRQKLPSLKITTAATQPQIPLLRNTRTSLSSNDTDVATPVKLNEYELAGPEAFLQRSSDSMTDSNPSIVSAKSTDTLISDLGNLTIQNKESESSTKITSKALEDLEEEDWRQLAELNQIRTLEVLGEGNGGSVKKCQLASTRQVFALKTITVDPSPGFQKQLVRELNYNRKFRSDYIVKYYGTFFNSSDASICICIEYMGGRSLDAIYKRFKEKDMRIGEKALGKMAESILRGLAYLNQQKVLHRDIKPQNILLDTMGNVKICDFGVSGEVVNSLATTFTGTSFYMAPERIRNEPYTITCDVWSLGLTLLEGAMGIFPFASQDPTLEISPIELLLIILEFEPELNDEPEENITWSASFKDFIKVCLIKENRKRPSPRQMLEHPWMRGQMNKKVRMDKLVQFCWED